MHPTHLTPSTIRTPRISSSVLVALGLALAVPACGAPGDLDATDREAALADDEDLDSDGLDDELASDERLTAEDHADGDAPGAGPDEVLPLEAAPPDLEPLDPDLLEQLEDAPVTVDDDDGSFPTAPGVALEGEVEPQHTGEMACATTSIADYHDGATVAMSADPSCSIAYDGSTSPDTSYDPADCPHQYITQVTGTYGRPLGFYWSWHGANLDSTTCNLAHASLSAYGATFSSWPLLVHWTKIGQTEVHGQWNATPWFNYCSWEYDDGYGPIPSLGANHHYFEVRTAAQATGFIFKQRVEGGVYHGPGPC